MENGKFLVVQGKLFDLIGVNDATINEMNEKALQLKIKGIDDKKGYEEVRVALSLHVKLRTSVVAFAEKDRKAAIQYQKDNIKEEKRIVALAAIGEDYLRAEKKVIDDAEEAIKQEKERQAELRVQVRRDQLAALGVGFNGQMWSYGALNLPEAMMKVASDEQFELFFTKFQDAFNAEQIRIEAERERQKEENDRLVKIAAEQEAERQRLEIVAQEQADKERQVRLQEKLEADERERKETEIRVAQKKIDDEKAEWERIKNKEVMELWKTRQAETARIEAEAKIKRELDDKAEKERLARVAAEKKAARRPDKEKLRAYLVNVFGVESPEMKTAEGKAAWEEIDKGLEELNMRLGPIVEAL